jgi:hypothetical protein
MSEQLAMDWACCRHCNSPLFRASSPLCSRCQEIDHRVGLIASAMCIDEPFAEWLAVNLRVYQEVVRLAREWRAIHGPVSKVGIATLWEALRWEKSFTTPGDDWKLNNTYRAPMARLVMEREQDLAGVFETRERRS